MLTCSLSAKEYHVSVKGDDGNEGTQSKPLKTISAAAVKARGGDEIIVHEGVYRERIDPPRGGTSDTKRIIYRAAMGDKVSIKGSEVVKGWKKVDNDTWKVVLPNSFFGDFNPYKDKISGDWYNSRGRVNHTGAVYVNGHWLTEAGAAADVLKPAGKNPLWFGQVDKENTTIHAQFKGLDPNKDGIEINARQAVFYPKKPRTNYITVRGFTLEHAATPWAPPTAEQIGLIGVHWSKGWIIENNTVRYSTCSGIALGKYGDDWDNRAQSAKGYVGTIKRALANGWSKENIGHHIVRNNHVSHCEQAGIVGSMGPVFCTVTGNTIHDIHVRNLFSGAEMAGIKFHGAIDTTIARNHIYRCGGSGGIWLDWMAQGTRVSCNLLHDNFTHDIFVEVNHGPFLIDNNICLSKLSLRDWSEGGAYVHNLMVGKFSQHNGGGRSTPYLKAHSTELGGLFKNKGGDNRFYNNVFASGANLAVYDKGNQPVFMAGNVYVKGAKPSRYEKAPLNKPDFDPAPEIVKKEDGYYLSISLDPGWRDEQKRNTITTKLLGKAIVPNLPFVQPDDSPYRIDTDYFGNKRQAENPHPGPFTALKKGKQTIKVWPAH